MKLIIFDLDQTLVDLLPVHDSAVQALFKRFFGVEARLTEIDFAGRSLEENFTLLAGLKRVPESALKRHRRELLGNYERIFRQMMPDDAGQYVLPGVRSLLNELSKRDCLLALYTGSSRGVVEKVFIATRLGKYFRLVQDSKGLRSRAGMVRRVIERARMLTGEKFKDGNIVVIGDSVRDIDAGKQNHTRTIAVATGLHSAEMLAGHKPDYIFNSFADYAEVLGAICEERTEARDGYFLSR